MLTKLTLTIEESVIKKAKRYAKQRGRSVSSMVQDYLDTVSSASKVSNREEQSSTPITDRLVGMFAKVDTGKSYKEMIEESKAERLL